MRNTLGGSPCRAVARRAFQAGGGNRVQYPPRRMRPAQGLGPRRRVIAARPMHAAGRTGYAAAPSACRAWYDPASAGGSQRANRMDVRAGSPARLTTPFS
jgi:hypothetical protein